MTALQVANVLQFVAVASLWLLVFSKMLPTVRLDSFRQKMFAVRDELFDYAHSGQVSFDDPAYVLLRRQMNALIRFGHQITVFRMMLTGAAALICECGPHQSWEEAWEPALANVKSEKARADLQAFYSRAVNTAVKHLLLGSPMLWLGMLLATVFLICRGAALGVRQLLKAAAKEVLVGPLNQKHIEDEAFSML